MEVLNDILKQQQQQTAEIQRLTKEIEILKSGANKPINLDASKVAGEISEKLNIGAEPILKATKELRSVIYDIPKSVEIKKISGIETSTKILFTAIILFLVSGFLIGLYMTPKIQKELYQNRINELEEHLEYHIKNNTKTEESYQKKKR